MRTTIDLPDDLYRELKARAALNVISMREYLIAALRASGKKETYGKKSNRKKSPFPLIHLKHTKVLDLSGFNFDDLLT